MFCCFDVFPVWKNFNNCSCHNFFSWFIPRKVAVSFCLAGSYKDKCLGVWVVSEFHISRCSFWLILTGLYFRFSLLTICFANENNPTHTHIYIHIYNIYIFTIYIYIYIYIYNIYIYIYILKYIK